MSIEGLKTQLADVPRTCASVIDVSVSVSDSKLLRDVGLPLDFAGWFRPVREIAEASGARGVTFLIGEDQYQIDRAFTIGRHDMGAVVIDADTGAVVFVADDGQSQLLNCSLAQLLLCVGQFIECSRNMYADIDARHEVCRTLDPAAFADENGPWSVLFEETKAGMF